MPAAFSFPSGIVPTTVDIRLESFTRTFSFRGITQAENPGLSRWVMELVFVQRGLDRNRLMAFLARCQGPAEIWSSGPFCDDNQGVLTGAPVTSAVAAAGATTIPTSGWTPSVTNIMREGDMFVIEDELKMCLTDVNSDITGLVPSIEFQPELRADIAAGSALTFSPLVSNWRLQDGGGMLSRPGKVAGDFAMRAIEAIPK